MAQSTITAQADEKDKSSFDAFCSNVVLNTSTAIDLFVKAVLRERQNRCSGGTETNNPLAGGFAV